MFNYIAYWKLNKKPFENTPDPAFLYLSKQHEEALLRLLYAVQERKGAAMLTGVFGCGKTLLGQAVLTKLNEEKYRFVNIYNPKLDAVELVMAVATQLGAHNPYTKKSDVLVNIVLDAIRSMLLDNMRDGNNTIIIVDEAHLISDPEVFEELRLLLNFQLSDAFLLTLLLFGQPELKEKIVANKALEQRIPVKCHLDKLDENDTGGYILHRIKLAGRSDRIFTDGAIKLIYEHSGGLPRRINNLCDMCLLSGFTYDKGTVDESLVKKEIKEALVH